MIRVSDYIAQFISDTLGLKDIFMLSGAGSMHLTDGVACNPKLRAFTMNNLHPWPLKLTLERMKASVWAIFRQVLPR